jgi:hypothetical protein
MIGLDVAATGSDRILRLAEWLANPAEWFAGDDGLGADHRSSFVASPLLRPLLNRHLSKRIDTARLPLDQDFVATIASSDEVARAIALATAPEATLHRAVQFLGAALCLGRLRTAVLRSERDHLTGLLGPDAMGFGLRRAPLIARALQSLPEANSADPIAAGHILCASLIHHASPQVHGLYRLRQDQPAEPVALTDAQARAGWDILDAAP